MIAGGPAALGARVSAGALACGAALLAPIALVSPLAVAPLFALVAVAAIAGAMPGLLREAWPRAGITLFAIAILWTGASSLWALEPGLVWRLWLSITVTAILGLALIVIADNLPIADRQRIANFLVIGLVVALTILTIEAIPRYLGLRPTPQQWVVTHLARRFNPSSLNRAATLIAIVTWLGAVTLARRYGWRRAWLLPAWAAMVAPAFESLAAVAASLAAAAAALLVVHARHATRRLAIAGIVIGFALMPLIPHWQPFYRLFADRSRDGSIWHRTEIWAFVADRIAERPLLGWGLNAARVVPGGKGFIQPGVENLPLHPHNAVLQIWLELGAVGATIGAAIAVLVVYHATSPGHAQGTRIGMTAAAAAALTVATTAYGLWQGWWMAALWLIAALARAGAMPERA